MARDTNVVCLVGRLIKEPELRYSNHNGTPYLTACIAANRPVKNGDEWKDEPNFFEFRLFGKRSEFVGKYAVKGQQVAVSGSLVQDRWEKDGQKFSKVFIMASDVQLLAKPKDAAESQGQNTGSSPAGNGGYEDDIPF